MPRLSLTALDSVLDNLLAHEPPASVMAIAETGLTVAMPLTVPLHGHPRIEVGSALELVSPDDLVAVIEAWERARETGAAQVTVRPLAAPGTELVLHLVDATHRYGVYLGFALGVVTSAAGSGPDDALRPRYGITHKNEVGLTLSCDDSVCRMLGLSADDLIGQRSLDLVHPEDQQRAIANWMDMLAHPGASRRVRLRHRRGDGRWMWVELTNHNLLNDPAHGYVLAEAVDISDEMAATEALRANEELLRRLTEALPVGVVQLDGEGRVVYRNDRAESVLDRALSPGRPFAATVGNEDLAGAVTAVLSGQAGRDGGRDLETAHPFADGAVRRIHVSLRALSAAEQVTGAIACLNDVTEAAELREELAHQATYDPLTGCLNRRAVLRRLDDLLAAGRDVTALFVDLDGFKQVNDRHGHAAGDALLRHVGSCLLGHADGRHVVGRLGGDEFLVLVTDLTGPDAVRRAVEAAERAIAEPVLFAGLRLCARASIGTARSHSGDADALIAAADTAMYRAKLERRPATG